MFAAITAALIFSRCQPDGSGGLIVVAIVTCKKSRMLESAKGGINCIVELQTRPAVSIMKQ